MMMMICCAQYLAALAIDKIGPKPYHFHSGPTSGSTTGAWAQGNETRSSANAQRQRVSYACLSRLAIVQFTEHCSCCTNRQ